MTFLFDDRRRWIKFGVAVLLFAALCVVCGLVVPVIRRSVFWYETHGDEFAGRRFAVEYQRVKHTYASHFTLQVRRGSGLRLTDAAQAEAATGFEGLPAPVFQVCGVDVRPGDIVSVIGVFRKPNLLVVSEIRTHPRRRLKYAAGVPAVLVVAWFAWRRLRLTPRGLALKSVKSPVSGDQ